MVTEWALNSLLTILTWVTGLIPGWTPPTWIASVNTFVESTAENALKLNNWIPLDMLGVGLIFTSACFVTALTIRTVRIVASFLTAGGGSAA